jgi:hypothetical protein
MTDQQESTPRTEPNVITASPLIDALGKAVAKLTSQIFIFLIAYLILAAFLTLSTSQIPAEIRIALLVIPILGLLVYASLKRRKILTQTRDLDVQVRAGIATGAATVAGVRGAAPDSLRSVKADVGYAGGRATVVGVDNPASAASPEADAAFLLQMFQKLAPKDRLELMNVANRIAAKALS